MYVVFFYYLCNVQWNFLYLIMDNNGETTRGHTQKPNLFVLVILNFNGCSHVQLDRNSLNIRTKTNTYVYVSANVLIYMYEYICPIYMPFRCIYVCLYAGYIHVWGLFIDHKMHLVYRNKRQMKLHFVPKFPLSHYQT